MTIKLTHKLSGAEVEVEDEDQVEQWEGRGYHRTSSKAAPAAKSTAKKAPAKKTTKKVGE